MQSPIIETFFDPATETASYLVYDPGTLDAAIIDTVLDYDPITITTSTENADKIIARVCELGLSTRYIMETHAHADHLSAAQYLKDKLGGEAVIGKHIQQTQEIFKDIFNLDDLFIPNGAQFDRLLREGDTIPLGNFNFKALHTPGHTPACMTYLIGDAAFVGDTLFMPDFGTARCDFPGGDAATLYASIQKILSLPDDTRIHTGHDYAPGGRDYAFVSTVADQKAANIHIGGDKSETDFISMREARDKNLKPPRLLLPSIQVNIRAGHLPDAEDNGQSYLKLPINFLKK